MPANNDREATRTARTARGSSGQQAEEGLARQLSELEAEPDMAALVQRIVDNAVIEIDGVEHAGISLIEGKMVRTVAATSDVARRGDELQYRAGDGPCLTSLRDHETVRSNDLASEIRWPGFSAAAAAHGARSMLSVQLFVHENNLGALNLYAGTPDAFDDHDESVAMLLASHAAIALHGSDIESHLRTALSSRDVIGQAKGILMERYKLSALQAFDLLARASQRSNLKLREIATQLTETGLLITDEPRQ